MDNESESSKHARVHCLWSSLDSEGNGHIDLAELKAGLKRLDHPLKDADHLLDDVMKAVDQNGNGRIEYHEFCAFIRDTEKQLWELFKSVDQEHTNGLSKQKLGNAFKRAGIHVSNVKLDRFFSQIDTNKDGVITFDEWRNFLLFIPADAPSLNAVLSYYTSAVKVNSEGDVIFSDETIKSIGYYLAGGNAGMISRTATAPLDRLKVYLIAQTGPTNHAVTALKEGDAVQASKQVARPLVDACRTLWRTGGISSFFAGNGLNVAKVMPESAIKFGSYEAAKRFLASLEGHGNTQQLSGWSQYLAGGIGGIISQFFAYPVDTLKFRMQCEIVEGGLHGNKLIAQTAKKMWTTGGTRSFYRGLPMGLVGMFPYSAIDLGTFDYLKRKLIARNMRVRGCSEEEAAPGAIATAAIGGFSGALGASIVYPINVLRTRLQTQGTAMHPRTYTGIVDVARQTIRGEGVRGLFKGLTPNLLKVVPAVSITYVVYEKTKKSLKLS